MHLRSLVLSAAAFLLATPAHAQSANASTGPATAPEFVPGRVIVKWRSPEAAAKRAQLMAFKRVLAPDRAVLATTATRAATEALVTQLRNDPDVVYAEPDYIRHRLGDPVRVTPNDELFAQQWALPMINAPLAWGRTTGQNRVTVAVIDTGWVQHPELVDRVVGGYDFIADTTNSGDGDGRDADPTDNGDSTDQSSALHGTHVAGIIAADTNTNGQGIAAVDWSCRLVIARALGIHHGTGVDSDIADAIRWAAGIHVDGVPDNDHPADVINMSFGGAGYSQTMQDAVHDAVGAGAIVVAAAGNLAVDAKDDSPAGLDGVITVGAVDETGQIASYSNYGTVLALMAPGGSPLRDPDTGTPEGVLSTIELVGSGYTYTYYAGTSQAAPFVSGTVSLMKAVYPSMNAMDARRILTATANPSAKCRNPSDPTVDGCGAGLLDTDAAVALAQDTNLNGPSAHLGNIVHGGYGCAVAGRERVGAVWVYAFLIALLAVRRRVL